MERFQPKVFSILISTQRLQQELQAHIAQARAQAWARENLCLHGV